MCVRYKYTAYNLYLQFLQPYKDFKKNWISPQRLHNVLIDHKLCEFDVKKKRIYELYLVYINILGSNKV